MRNPRHPLFQKAIALLESLPNLQATIQGEPYLGDDVLADGELVIHTLGKAVHYICEIKTEITAERVEQITQYFIQLEKRLGCRKRPLLITQNLSKLVVNQLIENKIEFIDIRENIYLNNTEFYILVRGQDKEKNVRSSLEITVASLQIIYVLLRKPIFLNPANSYNEKQIAHFSGVTTKTVRNTLEKLHELDYIQLKQGKYKILDHVKLLERWVLGYCEILRDKLLIGIYKPINNARFSDIELKLKDLAYEDGQYLLGGEMGASILTDYLRPTGATLHLYKNANHNRILVDLKLKPDPEGNIVLFKQFDNDGSFGEEQHDRGYGQPELLKIVNPLLIYAELIYLSDSRLTETAQIIYQKYIKELYNKNDKS